MKHHEARKLGKQVQTTALIVKLVFIAIGCAALFGAYSLAQVIWGEKHMIERVIEKRD